MKLHTIQCIIVVGLEGDNGMGIYSLMEGRGAPQVVLHCVLVRGKCSGYFDGEIPPLITYDILSSSLLRGFLLREPDRGICSLVKLMKG